MKNPTIAALTLCASTLLAFNANAASTEQRKAANDKEGTTVQIHMVNEDGTGDNIGTVYLTETAHGVVFTPDLKDLTPGLHGFHVHEKPSCDAAETQGKKTPAGAAGGHYDPEKSGKHGSPWGDGHLGDLPPLYVDQHGKASTPVLAPRIKNVAQISDRALMVHAGGDNHADHPAPLGGGAARVACGIIK